MKISIMQESQNQQTFGSFRLRKAGSNLLAHDFIKDKALEDAFIKEIAVPLQNTEGQVIFDGINVFYKKANESFKRLILDCTTKGKKTACTIMPVRKTPTNKETIITNSATVFNMHPYNKIELAKNIVLGLEKPTLNAEAIKTADTVNKKVEALTSAFELIG